MNFSNSKDLLLILAVRCLNLYTRIAYMECSEHYILNLSVFRDLVLWKNKPSLISLVFACLQLNPPAPEALKRMHMLAADPGIVAIMNKVLLDASFQIKHHYLTQHS